MNTHAAVLIVVMSLVTIALRFLPFVLFTKKTPAYISFLGRVLPEALIAMLVVYCLRNISLTNAPFGIPELLAGVCTAALQAWKKNSLLSILAGTFLYMFLVQVIF